MPSFVPPKKNTEYICYIQLVSQANIKLFQVNPTIAVGDVKVSIDGGAKNNITTLPVVTPAGSDQVKVTVSAAEMNGDNTTVTFVDVAGDEWASVGRNIQTVLTQIDTLVYDGGIWVDSGVGNTSTVAGVDGIPSNPVSTLVAARTLADALGIQKYFITNGSALTLAATHQWWEFVGIGRAANIINFGSQDIDNSRFKNLSVAGIQGGSTFIALDECILTSLVSLRPWARKCGIAGNITIQNGTMITFDQCYSGMPGDTTFELTFTAGNTSVNWRHGSGGLQVNNMTSDHTISYEADGQFIVGGTCVSANVTLRGNMSITDNGTATNITKDAVFNKSEALDAVVDDATRYSGADIAAIKAKTDKLPEINQKNVAFSEPFQFFMEDANGDPVSGLTVTGVKYLDGVKTAIATAITEVATGWYKMQPAQADTNGDHVSYVFSGAGAKDSIVEFWTTA